jgi:hypothetical protein
MGDKVRLSCPIQNCAMIRIDRYRIAPELRRCCWYIIAGAIGLVIVFHWIARFVQNRAPVDVAVGCVLFVLLAAAMALPLRWKLRVDQQGVARRLVFRWDSWAWADFATGRVYKLHPYTLCDPERPWWRRKLRLDYMASGEVQDVISAINGHYQLPAPPDVPATLTIKYGFRRSVTFDHDGIHLMICGRPHEYSWRELRDIHVTRMDPVRRDFKSLLITLPDQDIELTLVTHQGGTSPTWRGATSEEINEFLFQTVAAERIHVSIAGESLTKREHIEKKLQHAEGTKRDLVMMVAIFAPLMIATLVWMAMADGILVALLMVAVCVAALGPTFIFVFRSHTKQIQDLKSML